MEDTPKSCHPRLPTPALAPFVCSTFPASAAECPPDLTKESAQNPTGCGDLSSPYMSENPS